MFEVLGFAGALLMGIVLGLIGGGGSILTVPIFVYILGIEPVLATTYSLFVVGITASVGVLKNILKASIDFKAGIIFSIPAFIGVLMSRKYILPLIPDTLFLFSGYELTKSVAIMLFFALLMIIAAYFMIRSTQNNDIENQHNNYNYPIMILENLIIGVITGLVGAGGGFLIIPALVLLAKIPMKKAVGTSLLIIALKSLIGFAGDLQHFDIDWSLLFYFSALSVIGIFIGIYLTNFIQAQKLKKIFGWFVLIMAINIISAEFIF